MSDYDNELRGVLFRNKDKEEGTKQADYTGSATVEGVDYFLDAWLNVSKTGEKYMSVKLKRKEKQRTAPSPRTTAPQGRAKDEAYQASAQRPVGRMNDRRPRENDEADLDDSIPF